MKKTLLVLAVLLLAVGIAFGQTGRTLSNPVLFENGTWNTELGRVTATLVDGTDGEFANGLYVARKGALWRFRFENPIDTSAYRRLVVELAETSGAAVGWWAGGQLFNPVAEYVDNGQTLNFNMWGYWNDIWNRQRNVIVFNLATAGSRDAPSNGRDRYTRANIAGFGVKVTDTGTMSVRRVFLEN